MSIHTPGPWRTDLHFLGPIVLAAHPAKDGTSVCISECREAMFGALYAHQAHANARLIAAAPDLLAALDALLLAGYGMKNAPGVFKYADAFTQAAERAHAAIAKAESRQ